VDRTDVIDVPCWGFAVRHGGRISVLGDDEDVLDVGVGKKKIQYAFLLLQGA